MHTQNKSPPILQHFLIRWTKIVPGNFCIHELVWCRVPVPAYLGAWRAGVNTSFEVKGWISLVPGLCTWELEEGVSKLHLKWRVQCCDFVTLFFYTCTNDLFIVLVTCIWVAHISKLVLFVFMKTNEVCAWLNPPSCPGFKYNERKLQLKVFSKTHGSLARYKEVGSIVSSQVTLGFQSVAGRVGVYNNI